MIKLTPKQKEIAQSLKGVRYLLLYGGSRGGKTFALVYVLFSLALKYPGSRHLIARRYATDVRNSIWKVTLQEVLRGLDLHPGVDYIKNEVDMEIVFPNGSKIQLAGLDDAQRVDKILGTEYTTIYINESQDVPWQSVKILRTRLSQKISQNRFIADLNPTTSGHWTYKLWFEGVDPESGEMLPFRPMYKAIQVSPYDNAENLDSDYITMELETKTGNDRRRFLLGEYTTTSDLNVFNPASYFTPDDFEKWRAGVGYRLRIVGGLDLGYEDADALAFIGYMEGRPETFLLWEHKGRRQTVQELAGKIQEGLRFCQELAPGTDIQIYTDTGGGGKKIASELHAVYGLPVVTAYKRDKQLGIELLQDEVNTPGKLHIKEGGHFDAEARKIIWTRDLTGTILRVIDDSSFHPDMMDAILYPFRFLWSYGGDGLKKGDKANGSGS